jgi:methylisocitrate lyase
MPASAGSRFRAALDAEKPLQIAGCINAYAARMAERTGFRALYLSGGGVATASLGVPDLAISTLDDVLVDVRRITDITDLPLLVDADTGFGGVLNIGRTVKSLIKAGAGALHIEDQVQVKRCGHLPGKAVVSEMEMVERIGAAVEGLQAAIDRACTYVEAGADMIFPEAVADLETYRQFAAAAKVPILANITEFGATPLYTVEELAQADVSLVLYPLSAFRAMSAAALNVYRTIRAEGSQKSALPSMQTRAELYEFLDYHAYDEKLNLLFKPEKPEEPDNE